MANGKMLETLQKYTEQGTAIPDELFKSLLLQDAIDSSEKRNSISEDICLVHDKVTLLEERERTNSDEIERLRNRNNVSDTLTAIAVALGTWFGAKS